MTRYFIMVVALAVLCGCTQNQCAKNYGGKTSVSLPCGKKLTFATWKDDNLWYAYRDMREGEKPETTTLRESSSFGQLQGTVTFNECEK